MLYIVSDFVSVSCKPPVTLFKLLQHEVGLCQPNAGNSCQPCIAEMPCSTSLKHGKQHDL